MDERGVRLVVGDGNTFECTQDGATVASRIDFTVKGRGACFGPLDVVWGLSDHSAIGRVVQIDAVEGVVDVREAVDWDAVAVMVADEGEEWYGDLAGATAYDRLVDFRWCHLKRIRVCGRSKRWWDSDLSYQVRAVCRTWRKWVSSRNRNVLRAEVSKMKRMVREKKDRCWRTFCEDSGLRDP